MIIICTDKENNLVVCFKYTYHTISDLYGRQILTSKVVPLAERVNS